MEYAQLVSKFGDVPLFTEVIDKTDYKNLYKPRDSRQVVMEQVLADLQFAAANVRASDGKAGLTINKDVVLSLIHI